jgi:preprotein translocase subunit SecE
MLRFRVVNTRNITPKTLNTIDMSKFGTYIEETKDELFNKVTWPTWSELQSSAILVAVASTIIGLLVWGMDLGFDVLMSNAYKMVNGL